MTTSDDDDVELTFEPAPTAQQNRETDEKPSEPVAAGNPETQAGTPEPEPQSEDKAETSARPSLSGMLIAACLAVSMLASVTAAVQAWRAASIAGSAAAGAGGDAPLAARLNAMQTLLEQQRDAIDELSTRPGLAAAAQTPPQAVDGQINALAAAVRANQEMVEQLPSRVMKQVDARLARAGTGRPAAAAPKPAPRAATPQRAVSSKPQTSPQTVQRAAAAAPLPITQIGATPATSAQPAKRPAGEDIRYP